MSKWQPFNAYSCHCEREASCHLTCVFINYSGSKLSGRLNLPVASKVGHSDTDSLSRYRRRHLSERRQPATDLADVEPDSDDDIIPPSPTNDR